VILGAAELEIQDQQPKDDELGNADDPSAYNVIQYYIGNADCAAIQTPDQLLESSAWSWLLSDPST
jgi:hypothetical protein